MKIGRLKGKSQQQTLRYLDRKIDKIVDDTSIFLGIMYEFLIENGLDLAANFVKKDMIKALKHYRLEAYVESIDEFDRKFNAFGFYNLSFMLQNAFELEDYQQIAMDLRRRLDTSRPRTGGRME